MRGLIGVGVRARARRGVVGVVTVTAGALVVALLPAGSAEAGTVTHKAPHAPLAPSVHGVHAVTPRIAKLSDQAAHRFVPAARSWPSPAAASVTMTPGVVRRVASTPVSVRPSSTAKGSGTAQVDVLGHDRAATLGVHGVVLTVAPAGTVAGSARVSVDYSSFAQAEGGNYGSRLQLVSLPACALTTPQLQSCRAQTWLKSSNNAAKQQVSASIHLSPKAAAVPMVLAAVATAAAADGGGGGGTYAATPLKPSGSWNAGGSSGSFSYSVPVVAPPAASSLIPQVSLDYDSAAIDGQTASTQAQSSWVGDGWSTPESYIEQSFISCSNKPEGTAAPTATADNCYDGPLLTLSLNGSTSSLIWDAAKSVWKPQHDDGSVIKTVNATTGSGTEDPAPGSTGTSEYYWTVTTRSGTVFQFGRNHLPGWAAGKTATNSVQTEPVFSAHSGDPCYKATFSTSYCTMAYRWNLDYVVDVHNNAMSYYYGQATNYYGRFNGATDVSYVRDSWLQKIDYGFTDGNAYGTVPNRIEFKTGDRCLTGTCQPLNATNSSNWPDVPFSQICASGVNCTPTAPTFFSTVRLTEIDAEQNNGTSFPPVDSYVLTQSFPATGDTTSPTLWLSSVAHTGSGTTGGGSTTPVTMPTVSFTGVRLANRVDKVTDGLPAFYRYRIATVTTESGSVIAPTYTLVDPCTAPVTLTPSTNTHSCYPVSWTPDGYTDPFLDWFNKYSVTNVSQTDPTGGAPAVQTSYVYKGGAAWHYDDNELVKPKYRTYGQFRGYGDVEVLTGNGADDRQTDTEALYYRGMSKNNSTTIVNVTDTLNGLHEDRAELAGQTLEEIRYLGKNGGEDSSTITSYWVSSPSATRTRTGLPDVTATMVAPAEVFDRQTVTTSTGSSVRSRETDTTYNDTVTSSTFGLETFSYAHTVPAVAAYDQCTSTKYAAVNVAANLVGLVSQVETDAVKCAGFTEGTIPSVPSGFNTLAAPASVTRPDQVMALSQTFYDDETFGLAFPQAAAPTKANVTMIRTVSGYTGSTPTMVTKSRSTYDSVGRPKLTYDANGNKTTSTYTANAVGLPVGSSTKNVLNQTVSTTIDPQRGLPLTSTDANGVVTTIQRDAVGRTTGAWLHSRSVGLAADVTYTYVVSKTGVSSVTTKSMNEALGYKTSISIYDAMLRDRQTQTITPQGGRLVSDTFYDSHGWATRTNDGWWDSATVPNTTLVSAADLHAQVPTSHLITFDGLGRAIADDSQKYGLLVSTSTTIYDGDRVTTIPPAGGVAGTSITDPMGRTVELDQYTSAPAVQVPADRWTAPSTVTGGAPSKTMYGFDVRGNQSSITADGSTWTTTYNILGQVQSKLDPDAGQTQISYDANNNPVQTTDGRGKTISFVYDGLNRKAAEYDATVAAQAPANLMASWTYDNSTSVAGVTNAIGQLTASSAKLGTSTYSMQQTAFNVFGESLGQTITIPSAEGNLAGTYAFSHTYSPNTGLLKTDVYPAAGGLPSETVQHGYSGILDLPFASAGAAAYAQSVTYDAFGRVNQETIGGATAATKAFVTNTYDDHTDQLLDQLVTRGTSPTTVDDQAYTYDLAGNLTRQVSTRLGSTATSETQCYAYNPLDQLTGAWTATDNCAATPSTAAHGMVGDLLGASSAYWTTWDVSPIGKRNTQTDYSTTSGVGVTTTYNYNGNGAGQPHTMTSTTGGAAGLTTYTYDVGGNMKTRNAGQGAQSFTWDDGDRLTAIDAGTTHSTFVYDADGGLLIQKDPGTNTLYLPDEQLSLNTTTNAVTGVRYYGLPGGGTAYRIGSATTAYGFELGDQHGSQTLRLDSTAQTPTWRQFTPYGAPRGSTAAWIDNRSFLNKPADPTTGLTILGAREYDPNVGSFTSVDPVMDATDPQSLNGYSYVGGNPIGRSDPTGLKFDSGSGGGGSVQLDYFGYPQGYVPHMTPAGNPSPPEKKKSGHHWGIGSFVHSVAHAAVATASWADEHKGAIAGAVVGTVVFVGCEGITGGAGSIGCAAAAGAVGNMVTHAVETPIDQWTPGGFAKAGIEGAISGAAFQGGGMALGRVASPILSKAAAAVGSKLGRTVAEDAESAAALRGEVSRF